MALRAAQVTAEQAQAMVFEAGNLPSGLYLIRAVGEYFAATRRVIQQTPRIKSDGNPLF